jgi:O-antigen/teichoic acid export membrane protein
VGLYVAAFAIANRLPVIPSNLLADVLRPALFEAQSRHQSMVVRKIIAVWFGALLAVSLILLVLVIRYGDLIAYLLLQDAYRTSAARLMPWIVGAAVATSFNGAMDQYLMSRGQSRILLIPKIIAPVTSVGCSIALVPHYALLGAALANLAGQAIQLLTTTLLVIATTRKVEIGS